MAGLSPGRFFGREVSMFQVMLTALGFVGFLGMVFALAPLPTGAVAEVV